MYSRANPSETYSRHLNDYIKMHAEGYEQRQGDQVNKVSPENTYPGEQLLKFRQIIKEVIDHTGAKTILDYGCGKGLQYGEMDIAGPDGSIVARSVQEYWGVKKITLYDPAVPSHNELPKGKFDGVVSTDVMEHIPLDDVAWIVAEKFKYAKKFVFANIACYPALATMPDGSNAHATIKHPSWWDGLFHTMSAQSKNDVKYLIVCVFKQVQPDGTQRANTAIYTNIPGIGA